MFSDHKTLEGIGKVGDHIARVQWLLEFIIAFDYTLEYRKDQRKGRPTVPFAKACHRARLQWA